MDLVLQKSPRQVTLVSDAWTNLRGESIINYVAVTRKHAIFVKSTPSGGERHNAQYIADGVEQIVKELGEDNIVCFTADNARNMKAAQALLGQRFPKVLMLGCASHIVNLIVEDIFKLPPFGNIFKLAVELSKYFKSSYVLVGLLSNAAESLGRARPALQLPGNTRWQGKLNTVASVLKNRDFLEHLALHPDGALPEHPTNEQRNRFSHICSIILSIRFWEQLSSLERLLRPFLEVTLALESVRPKASRIFAYFKYLIQKVYTHTTSHYEDVLDIIGKRFKQIHHPIMTVAYICDPQAREERKVAITDTMDLEMQEYLQHYYSDARRAAGVYKELQEVWHRRGAYSGPLNWSSFKDYTDAGDWWSIQSCSQDLKDLATYALSINPTSGAAERNWSVHGFLHSKSRNKLANRRVEQLVYVYTNLRIRDSILSSTPDFFNTTEVEEDEADETVDDDVQTAEPKEEDGDISQIIG